MAIPSRFLPVPDAWDLVFATDTSDTDPLTLKLVEDGSVAMWEGSDAPALSSDQNVYQEQAVMWTPLAGAGYSRRTPETTGTGPDGQITSQGVSYGRNATFVVPGVALPAGKVTEYALPDVIPAIADARIWDMAEYGGHLYATTGTRYLLKIASGSGAPSVIDFGATYVTGQMQIFDGNLILAGANSGPIQSFNGTTWTAGAASCIAQRMERVNWLPSNSIMEGSGGGVPADHLILTDFGEPGFYHVVTGSDPLDFANWIGRGGGDPIKVGDPNYIIQNLVSGGRTIWFAKQNGLHGFTETGRCVNLTPWVERLFHGSNGGAVLFWSDENRALVFYGHEHGLVAINVNGTQQETARFVQFGAKQPREVPIYGRPRWMCPYVDGIFVGYFSGGTSYVMRLILEADGSYRWSGSEWTIPNEELTFMRVMSPGGIPRLWIATITGLGVLKLYYQSLPRSGDPWMDYQHDLGHQFAQSWDVYLPRDDAGSSAPKVVRRYDIVARGVGNGNTVSLEASADDGDYVAQGSISEGTRASFIATEYQTGVEWNWKVACTNDEDAPVALETVQARMSVLPEQSDVWTFRCNLSAGQGLGNDAEDTRDPYTIRARVRALQRRGPILMRRSPLSRETLVVKVEPGFRIQTIRSRATNEHIVVLTMTVSVLAEGAVYDAGDVYGTALFGVAEAS